MQKYLDITSANSTLFLSATVIIPVATKIENFSVDNALQNDDHEISQGRMGVDGGIAFGVVNNPYPLTITLEAGSPSMKLLSNLYSMMQLNKVPYECSLVLHIPSISETHIWTHGCLTAGKVVPDVKKVLDPTTWRFMFGEHICTPI